MSILLTLMQGLVLLLIAFTGHQTFKSYQDKKVLPAIMHYTIIIILVSLHNILGDAKL